ncbi:hypothetical protein D7207_38805 [Burkholderia cepacia]|nr:hypothetical protein [Burkholderia cepacia]MBA9979556.1 hypothetical protein [Burkholderia cepacia]MBA9998366.1 hypothetical protein [Burkholderia cepacia]MBB0006325.1 hypothetical protein [Burkholderia cepacia]MBB0014008.1 hypothetical protein [Burkholderia cepacia]
MSVTSKDRKINSVENVLEVVVLACIYVDVCNYNEQICRVKASCHYLVCKSCFKHVGRVWGSMSDIAQFRDLAFMRS